MAKNIGWEKVQILVTDLEQIGFFDDRLYSFCPDAEIDDAALAIMTFIIQHELDRCMTEDGPSNYAKDAKDAITNGGPCEVVGESISECIRRSFRLT